MEYGVIGISHKSAPVEVREKFSLNSSSLVDALQHLKSNHTFEAVLVSTCNRFELYCLAEGTLDRSMQFLEEYFSVDRREVEPHYYHKTGQATLRHLFRVVCGLDSLVFGEAQILGQIKEAWITAQTHKASGKLLNGLFERAVRFGKMCRTQSKISSSQISVASVAVNLAERALNTLDNKVAMLLGAGEMARIAVQHLRDRGLSGLIIANRSIEHANLLASEFSGEAIPLAQVQAHLDPVDLIISAVGGGHILTPETLAPSLARRPDRPIVLIDIAMPRSIHPDVGKMPGVTLHDIDSLQSIVDKNAKLRAAEAAKIELWIEDEIIETSKWLKTELVTPLIKELTNRVRHLQQETMQKIKDNAPHLDAEIYSVVDRYSNAALNGIVRHPIKRLKELSIESDGTDVRYVFDHFANLFELPQLADPSLHRLLVELTPKKAGHSATK